MRQLHLNINALNAGAYASAWRWPGSAPEAFADIAHYQTIARWAERGRFDAMFLADTPSLKDRIDLRPWNALEPTVVLAAVAAQTQHLGLIATASTSYNEPYNIARRYATLDRISGGRAAWNIVTTADADAALNFGLDARASHAERYARADEFASVVRQLWHSWEPDSFIGDVASARFADASRVHPIQHRGERFAVQGANTVPPSPQGHPVLVQAGGSDDGRELAACHAEVVFSVAQTVQGALDHAQGVRRRAAALGRDPAHLLMLPGLCTVIGDTEAAARQRRDALSELVPPAYALARLSQVLNVDVSTLPLDQPLPDDLPLPSDGHQTAFRSVQDLAQREGLTLRGLMQRLGGGIGHRTVVGTPAQVADDIEHWWRIGAADGFNLMPDVLPEGLQVFVEQVVPLLQRRGIFRREYEGLTLRGHLGLPLPSRASSAGPSAVAPARLAAA